MILRRIGSGLSNQACARTVTLQLSPLIYEHFSTLLG
jgi:hypothetical protein